MSCFALGQYSRIDYANFLYTQYNYKKANSVYQKVYQKKGLKDTDLTNYLESLYLCHQYKKVIELIGKKDTVNYSQGIVLLKSYQFTKDTLGFTATVSRLLKQYPDSAILKNYQNSMGLMTQEHSKGYIVGEQVRNLKKGATFPYAYASELIYFYPKQPTKLFRKYYSQNNLSYKISKKPPMLAVEKEPEICGPIWYNDSLLFLSNYYKNGQNGKRHLKIDCYYRNRRSILPFCVDSVSITHPAFDPQNNRLYFALKANNSNSDIYYSDYLYGNWSKPQKLNDNINTSGNEMFPYIHGNFLYFTSDGLPGIGGMDLYEINIAEIATKQPTNLGRKINSPFDDFSICFSDNYTGYFSSNRKDYADAIYRFKFDTTAKINHCINQCENTSCISLSHEYSEDKYLTTKWIVGNGDTLLGQKIDYCYSEKGTYNCELLVYDTLDTELLMFQEFFTVTIEENLKPAPGINIKIEGQVGESIKFLIDSTHKASVFAQEWNFGDGFTSNKKAAHHVYQAPGVYQVSCRVFYHDTSGLECCKTQSTSYINIKDTVANNSNKGAFQFAGDEYYVSIYTLANTEVNYQDYQLTILNENNRKENRLPLAKKIEKIQLNKEHNYKMAVVHRHTKDTLSFDRIQHDGKQEHEFEDEVSILLYNLDTVFFKPNSFRLTNIEKKKLDVIIDYLKLYPTYQLRIEGYTDAVGGELYNLNLSKRRVNAVKAYLINNAIENSRVAIHAFGEQKIGANEEILAQGKNRRVELIIEKNE
ncbi:MAG: OmpA family protein [Flavobacteriales bacterium]|nr:OmpA family protein [Flavobacteriales bacterium]